MPHPLASLCRFCLTAMVCVTVSLLAQPFAGHAHAQADPSWPARPVRLILPHAPGGTADVVARLLGERLSALWGQTVIVENRTGAAGIIAMEALTRAAPDGYTIGLGNLNTVVTNPLFRKSLPYDPEALTSLAWLTTSPLFLIVAPQLPVHSVAEFIEYARARPGELSYGSIGNGSTMHLATLMLQQRTGLDMIHVPYKGMGAALADLMAGRVSVALDISAMSMVRAGKLRALAVAADERYPGEPDLPAFGEVGLKNLTLVTFLSLHAPPGLPQPLVQRINADVNRVLQQPDVIARIKAMHLDPQGGSADRLTDFLMQERLRYAEVVKRAGIEPE